MFELNVADEIFDAFPDYRTAIIYADGLINDAEDPRAIELLRRAQEHARAVCAGVPLGEHPYIAPWRAAYSRFGAKPKKYPCSSEALLKRVADGKELPSVGVLVDLYNAISLRHFIPVGGEDRDRLTSDLTLRFASGGEPFDTTRDGQPLVEFAEKGEAIWLDSTGVTCRRWNWRQCRRTALRPDTRSAYFVLDRLEPVPIATLSTAADDLEALIRQFCPHANLHRVVLGTRK